MNAASSTYREQLRAELHRRQMVNSRYSLRAFSTALGYSAPFVSKVLSGQKNISLEAAAQICSRLGYSKTEAAQFCQLVQIENTTSTHAREYLQASTQTPDEGYSTVSLDTFQVLSDWYHYAILELTTCRGFRSDPTYIAKKLRITPEQAKGGVARLLRLGLLKTVNGRWKKTDAYLATPSDQPNQALKNFHEQMLEKARNALKVDPVGEREITGLTLSIAGDQLGVAKSEIRKFLMRLSKQLDSSRANRVVQLNVQLFSLSEPT